MSETNDMIDTVTAEKPDPIKQAIALLTEAARETRVRGAGTPNEQREPVDFGEIACHVLTAVAANIGGVEQLLAGRPGSWEAAYVRQIVLSTAGDDDMALVAWRTEPVRLQLDVEAILDDFGLFPMYEEELDALVAAEDAAHEAVVLAHATADERARIDEIQDAMPMLPVAEEDWQAHRDTVVRLQEEAASIWQDILDRATGDGSPLMSALHAAREATERLDALWKQDQASYFDAYSATVRRVLIERTGSPGAAVIVEDATTATDIPNDDPLVWELHDAARAQTPLPMTGAAPDWTSGTPADAVRRAGLTYRERSGGQASPPAA